MPSGAQWLVHGMKRVHLGHWAKGVAMPDFILMLSLALSDGTVLIVPGFLPLSFKCKGLSGLLQDVPCSRFCPCSDLHH